MKKCTFNTDDSIPEINFKYYNIMVFIQDFLDQKINDTKNNILFYSHFLNQEIPNKKITKFNKNLHKKELIEPKIQEVQTTIIETIEQAKNIITSIKNDNIKKPLKIENIKKDNKKPINNRKSMSLARKQIIQPEKSIIKSEKIIEDKKMEQQKIEKLEENKINTFKRKNLDDLSKNNESLTLFLELKKKYSKIKKEFIDFHINNEKAIKPRSKFINKLYSHYKEKKKVLLNKKNELNLTIINKKDEFHFIFNDSILINYELYILKNFVQLLDYYLNIEKIKEINEINLICKENKKTTIINMFYLWCYCQYFKDNIELINNKITDFLQNNYKKYANNLFSKIFTFITIKKIENTKKISQDFFLKFDTNEYNSELETIIKLEKTEIKKINNEYFSLIFENLNLKLLNNIYLKKMKEIISKAKKEEIKILCKYIRFSFFLINESKGCPMFFNKIQYENYFKNFVN